MIQTHGQPALCLKHWAITFATSTDAKVWYKSIRSERIDLYHTFTSSVAVHYCTGLVSTVDVMGSSSRNTSPHPHVREENSCAILHPGQGQGQGFLPSVQGVEGRLSLPKVFISAKFAPVFDETAGKDSRNGAMSFRCVYYGALSCCSSVSP
jgi:hypothetical protein